MATPTSKTTSRKAVPSIPLNKTVFGVIPSNHSLLHSAYIVYLANGRTNSAITKTRGLVRGGGRKPWSQKGTGRARFGSIRTPIWRGGGITFGPTGQENYTRKLSQAQKHQALRQALSLAASDNQIIVTKEIVSKNGKTNEVINLMSKLGANSTPILLVVDHKNEKLIQATNNLRQIKLVQAQYLNVFDVLNSNYIVINELALKVIGEWLGKEEK